MFRLPLSLMKKHATTCRHLKRLFSSANQTPRMEPKFKDSFDAFNLVLICPITCFCLCYWQIQRKKWKNDLISTLDSRLNAEPRPIPEDLSGLEDLELYPVRVKGHFDYTEEVFIGPRGMSSNQQGETQAGVHAVTPFVLADRNLKILVNRGFISNAQLKQPDYVKKGQVHGETEVVGFIRKDQQIISIMTYLMDMNKCSVRNGREIYPSRKLDLLAERCGTAPVFLDAKEIENENQYSPFPAEPGRDIRDKHIEYAVIWAVLGSLTFGIYLRRQLRLRREMQELYSKQMKKSKV
ncbi:Surfeit locus protein 1 [Mactra antiquata]